METRKKLQWTAVAAFAVTACTWAGADNASAAVTAADIEVSGTAQKMYVNVSQDKEMVFGTATRSRKSGKVVFKVSAWNLYETGSSQRAEIDLSKLSNVKDNYIAVKTDDMEVPVIVKIPANDKVSSVRYNGATQELEIKTGASRTSLKAASDYEWRTVYSNWQTPDETEKLADGKVSGVFGEFQFQGGTLYIRTPGEGLSKITETSDNELKDCYDAGNIDKAVKEAAEFEAQDKKRKEGIDAKNEADSLLFQTEKALSEVGDKIDAADKSAVEADCKALREILDKVNMDDISDAQVAEMKAAKEKLMESAQKVFTKMYEQAGAAAQGAGPDMGAGPNPGAGPAPEGFQGDDVVDGDYKEV